MMISFSKPCKGLDSQRPIQSIFNGYFLTSVLLQFMVHFGVLLFIVQLSDPYTIKDESTKPDGEFKPNIKNSAVFLYNWTLTATTFFVNYEGRPFMLGLRENKYLYKALLAMYAVIILCLVDQIDIIYYWLELTPFPNTNYQMQMGIALGIDFFVCYGIETVIKKFIKRSQTTTSDNLI
jgi:cation-transporting ATPase 13A1